MRNWERRGVIGNYEELLKKWKDATNCYDCNISFDTEPKTRSRKCLDHNHETGEFRNILCTICNIKRK